MPFRTLSNFFGTPMMPVPEGETVLLRIIGFEESTKFKGEKLVQVETLDGTQFRLIGHVVLINKLTPEVVDNRQPVCQITNTGKTEAYYDYEVQVWEGTQKSLMSTTTALQTSTEAILQRFIESISTE